MSVLTEVVAEINGEGLFISYKLIPIVILVTRVKSEWVGRETL